MKTTKMSVSRWIIVFLISWLFDTVMLSVIIRTAGSQSSTAHAVRLAAVIGIVICIVIGGPSAAVAIWIDKARSWGSAQLAGMVTGALIVAVIVTIALVSGWLVTAFVPILALAMIAFETGLALTLNRRLGTG
jgi:hypothetical protein